MILLDKDLPKEIAEEVKSIDEAIELIKILEQELAMSTIPGIGLSCPQIGINKAAAIVRLKNNDPNNPIQCVNLVNPVLLEGHDLILFTEGCLSFPGKSAVTIRYSDIVIETFNDYNYYAEQINARRSERQIKDVELFKNERIRINLGPVDQNDYGGSLLSVAVQHEFAHLLGLTFLNFAPQEIGRNDKCICGSQKKNKKCCNEKYFNTNLLKLFKPNYR